MKAPGVGMGEYGSCLWGRRWEKLPRAIMSQPGPLCCLRAAPECDVEAAAPPLIWCEPSEEGETTYEEL